MAEIRNKGLLISGIFSGIFHFLILMIPLSVNVKQKYDFKNIEIFVVDEPVIVKKTLEARQEIKSITKQSRPKIEKEVLQQKTKEPVVQAEPQKPVTLPSKVEVPPKETNDIAKKVENVLAVNKVNAEVSTQSRIEKKAEGLVTLGASSIKEPTQASKATAEKTSGLREVEFGSTFGPRFLYKENPYYPLIARKLGKEGKVVLRLHIDEYGRLLNVEVVERADYGFTEAAVEAVKKSTFLPAKIEGRPVSSMAILPIRFTLRRD